MSEGTLVWITGLPSAGKSTFANLVRSKLAERGEACLLLDGDEVRSVLVPTPGYDPAARDAFYATLAQLAALLVRQGAVVLVPATAHKRAYREHARGLVTRFVEVFIDVPADEARRRDAKGLYAAAAEDTRAGGDLPGVGTAYEPPLAADIVSRDGRDEDAARALVAMLVPGSAQRKSEQ
jgi:adenylylsulfate kinase